jgi:fucose permease
MVMFLAGWNDASQGPLLPALQEYYNVSAFSRFAAG